MPVCVAKQSEPRELERRAVAVCRRHALADGQQSVTPERPPHEQLCGRVDVLVHVHGEERVKRPGGGFVSIRSTKKGEPHVRLRDVAIRQKEAERDAPWALCLSYSYSSTAHLFC